MRVAIQQIKAWDWMVSLVNPTSEIFNCEKKGVPVVYNDTIKLKG